jgi:hypothetical protein
LLRGDYVVEEIVGIECSQIEGSQSEPCNFLSVEVVEFKALGVEKPVVGSIIFMVAGDHNERNLGGSFCDLKEELFVVCAVVAVEVVAHISVDDDTVDLLLQQGRPHQTVNRLVLVPVDLYLRPIG